MLYTGKGDTGTTGTFGCSQRISKSSTLSEALGSVDEINSLLGLCKVRSSEKGFTICELPFREAVNKIQMTLFVVQAELAGSKMSVTEEKVKEVEGWIRAIEKELPPIHSFFVSGGSELAALFDVSRTVARRAERRVVAAKEEGIELGVYTLAYMNRLSSILYALARLSNHKSGITEQPPDYKQ